MTTYDLWNKGIHLKTITNSLGCTIFKWQTHFLGLGPDPTNKISPLNLFLYWNWPIGEAKIGRMTYLIGQILHTVKFFTGILYKGLGPCGWAVNHLLSFQLWSYNRQEPNFLMQISLQYSLLQFEFKEWPVGLVKAKESVCGIHQQIFERLDSRSKISFNKSNWK